MNIMQEKDHQSLDVHYTRDENSPFDVVCNLMKPWILTFGVIISDAGLYEGQYSSHVKIRLNKEMSSLEKKQITDLLESVFNGKVMKVVDLK